MLTTKQFADLCKTTKRTIMYYDQNGLLKPAKRLDNTRYYLPQQILKFEKISLLQSLGLTLSEIRQSLVNHATLSKIFQAHKNTMLEKQRKLNNQVKKINELLANLQQEKQAIVPKKKHIPAYTFYGIKKTGRYVDMDSYCRELASLLNDTKREYTYFVIFPHRQYSPTQADLIIGAIKKGRKTYKKQFENVSVFTIPAHIALSYRDTGSYQSLGYIWDMLELYVDTNHYIRNEDIYPREIYKKGPMAGSFKDEYVTELQIPIRPPFPLL